MFPNQACLKGFLLSLIRNAFRSPGRAVPPHGQPVPPAPGAPVPPVPGLQFPSKCCPNCFCGLKSFSKCRKESQQIALGGLKSLGSAKSVAKIAFGGLKSLESANSVAKKCVWRLECRKMFQNGWDAHRIASNSFGSLRTFEGGPCYKKYLWQLQCLKMF